MKEYKLQVSNSKNNNLTKMQQLFIEKLSQQIVDETKIVSLHDYNRIVRELVFFAKKQYRVQISTPIFSEELTTIEQKKPLTESTIWGGVTLKKVDVEKDLIEKLLVIREYGILGFEIHEKKDEKLEIIEGSCLVVHVDHINDTQKIALNFASKGDKFHFEPGEEHGVIALTNCVIKENSTNHLDDLIYIFKASQIM